MICMFHLVDLWAHVHFHGQLIVQSFTAFIFGWSPEKVRSPSGRPAKLVEEVLFRVTLRRFRELQ